LVIGLDANPAGMRRASARAARRDGLPNAAFVWASVERLPPELTGVTELHVVMPWGSLLRAVLGGDEGALAGLARACAPGARFLVALNLHAWRPPVAEIGGLAEPTPESAIDELAPVYARAGWQLEDAAYLDATQIEALQSSWTRRLNRSRAGRFDVLALTGRRLSPPPPAGQSRASPAPEKAPAPDRR
jgi:SAM-dependent methyltransferase